MGVALLLLLGMWGQANVWSDPAGSLPMTCKKIAEPDQWNCRISMGEPLDVSAIRVNKRECIREGFIVPAIPGGRPGCEEYGNVPHETCADKTRILEHDEQTPPKYWCRKIEP